MELDLPGRVRNVKLAYTNALCPLFEAVINSIHAVEEAPHPGHGIVRIYIERDQSQTSLPAEVVGTIHQPVKSFTIRDNGIGFTDLHYESFSTADTQLKWKIGGKGIGRFLWLKAFDHAEIESVFQTADGKRHRRKFNLRLTRAGVEDHTGVEADDNEEIGTSVRLCDYKPEYQREVPHSPERIARRIIEHCLEYFVLGSAPEIYVHDSDSAEVHFLNDIFEEEIKIATTIEKFKANGRDFQVQNLKVSPSYQNTHMTCPPTLVHG